VRLFAIWDRILNFVTKIGANFPCTARLVFLLRVYYTSYFPFRVSGVIVSFIYLFLMFRDSSSSSFSLAQIPNAFCKIRPLPELLIDGPRLIMTLFCCVPQGGPEKFMEMKTALLPQSKTELNVGK